MRELATIQRIAEKRDIEGANFIEQIRVLGWWVIAKRDDFHVGDLAIFLEPDSILPDKEEWVRTYATFMERYKWRVHTIRMRGKLSQGLVLPIEVLNTKTKSVVGVFGDLIEMRDSELDDPGSGKEKYHLSVGNNVTDLLKIVKYEIVGHHGFTSGNAKATFPMFIPKTNELRLQSKPGVLEELQDNPYVITVKVDGTSSTFYKNGEETGVCSRQMVLKADTESVYWKIENKYDILKKLQELEGNYAIQGEIAGPGIQKNTLGLDVLQLYAFNVFDTDTQKYLDFDDFYKIMWELHLPYAEIIEIDEKFNYTMEELIELSAGTKYHNGEWVEGIVVRSKQETYSPALKGRLSFKVLNNNFLEKHKL